MDLLEGLARKDRYKTGSQGKTVAITWPPQKEQDRKNALPRDSLEWKEWFRLRCQDVRDHNGYPEEVEINDTKKWRPCPQCVKCDQLWSEKRSVNINGSVMNDPTKCVKHKIRVENVWTGWTDWRFLDRKQAKTGET